MVKKGRKEGTIRFSTPELDSTAKVFVAGSFSQWQPRRMKKQKNGSYALTLPVDAGEHEYKFIIDSNWILDPENDHCAMSPVGTMNSVAAVA